MGKLVEIRRHGDVLLKTHKGFVPPKGLKFKATKLIHKGTNNSHVITKGIVMKAEAEGVKYIRVKKAAIIDHVGGSSTHKAKPIPAGSYWIEIQTFYDHLAEEAKKVID